MLIWKVDAPFVDVGVFDVVVVVVVVVVVGDDDPVVIEEVLLDVDIGVLVVPV